MQFKVTVEVDDSADAEKLVENRCLSKEGNCTSKYDGQDEKRNTFLNFFACEGDDDSGDDYDSGDDEPALSGELSFKKLLKFFLT